jgi:phage shock protein A
MSTDEKILNAIESLKADVQQQGKQLAALQADMKGLHTKVDTLDKKGDTLEVRIEAVHAYQKQAHTEIMDCLYESNESTGRSQKALEKRIERIEKHLGLSPLK